MGRRFARLRLRAGRIVRDHRPRWTPGRGLAAFLAGSTIAVGLDAEARARIARPSAGLDHRPAGARRRLRLRAGRIVRDHRPRWTPGRDLAAFLAGPTIAAGLDALALALPIIKASSNGRI